MKYPIKCDVCGNEILCIFDMAFFKKMPGDCFIATDAALKGLRSESRLMKPNLSVVVK